MSSYAAARNHTMANIAAALAGLVNADRIYWQGVVPTAGDNTPSATEAWAAVHYRHNDNGSGQASLAGADGAKRWQRTGTVVVQCFAPLGAAGGDAASMVLARAIQSKLQEVNHCRPVVYLSPTAREVGPDRSWYQSNAAATFQYYEVS